MVELYSDNGINFRRAAAEIKELLKQMDFNKISQYAVNMRFKWSFIPPAVPHMGVAWEKLVRSIKTTLNVF